MEIQRSSLQSTNASPRLANTADIRPLMTQDVQRSRMFKTGVSFSRLELLAGGQGKLQRLRAPSPRARRSTRRC